MEFYLEVHVRVKVLLEQDQIVNYIQTQLIPLELLVNHVIRI